MLAGNVLGNRVKDALEQTTVAVKGEVRLVTEQSHSDGQSLKSSRVYHR